MRDHGASLRWRFRPFTKLSLLQVSERVLARQAATCHRWRKLGELGAGRASAAPPLRATRVGIWYGALYVHVWAKYWQAHARRIGMCNALWRLGQTRRSYGGGMILTPSCAAVHRCASAWLADSAPFLR
ncbi:hypothetical protein QAD02_013433 [Eretmocerus hayati]|uniref:Uncharacterized protein n=1 Tax=Eretmocerus hayati TaxID=131215 RepID=A0ACC2P2I4_9HYME|nr:hypothetical protein QAD02_013433 [Eretmocerus hayati]